MDSLKERFDYGDVISAYIRAEYKILNQYKGIQIRYQHLTYCLLIAFLEELGLEDAKELVELLYVKLREN